MPEQAPQDITSEALLRQQVVETALRQEIAHYGRIPFTRYMETCLHNDQGYYHSGYTAIGDSRNQGADFTTSPETHPVFGAAIAHQLHGMWQTMGRPAPFDIVEMGAGNGTLARDILRECVVSFPKLANAAHYAIIEQSPGLIERQRQTLSTWPVAWYGESALALPFDGLQDITGVLLSNELPDTFPVHRLIRRGNDVQEIYTALDDSRQFIDSEDTAECDLPEQLKLPDGAESSYCPDLKPWVSAMAGSLAAGYAITIDYSANGLEPRPPRTFSRHNDDGYIPQGQPVTTSTKDLYRHPGLIDITTSVDFDMLQHLGEEAGLQTELRTQQADFLDSNDFSAILQRMIARHPMPFGIHHLAAHPLRDPGYMGDFEVLIQSKGLAGN